MQFSYTEIGNPPDGVMFLNERCHFYTETGKFPDDFMSWRYAIFMGWIFCIFQIPYEKTNSTNWCSTLPWSKTTKIQKSQKINLYKKYVTAMISQTVHRQESSKVAVKHCHMPIWASHSTFCSKFTETVKMMACVIWLPPLEAIQRPVKSMCDCFHFLPHTGDLIYCNVFVDGGHTVLNSETPPWLVFGDWTISVH